MDERVLQFKLEVLDYEAPTSIICPFCAHQKTWIRPYLSDEFEHWDMSLDEMTIGELLDVIETHLRKGHPDER